jgi:hypothetical protein
LYLFKSPRTSHRQIRSASTKGQTPLVSITSKLGTMPRHSAVDV